MNNQEQANILTLCGEQATRRGYELFNANGDNLGAVLTDAEVEFIQEHRCTSDCRRIGCEAVESRAKQAAIFQ